MIDDAFGEQLIHKRRCVLASRAPVVVDQIINTLLAYGR